MKITTNLNGGVMTVTLADPDNRNALSGALLSELLAAIDAAEADHAVRVVVVTNEGHIFSAGADLNESAAGESYTARMAEVFTRVVNSPKPFVGRIAGHAVAGGVGRACAMDISIAIEDAKFGFTEVRVGVAPAIISTICLPKMTRADAAAAFLRGNRFLAPEAARLGLINEAVSSVDLNDRVDAVVADLLLGAPEALAATKSLLTRVPAMHFDEAMDWASELSERLFGADEAKEGMTAYLEKRRPNWVPDG